MRTLSVFLSLTLVLLGPVSSAQFEITADNMRDIEDVAKSLDSNVALKDAKAVDEARELVAFFQQVEAFYVQKGDAAQGVGFARKSHELAKQALAAVEAKNYDAAGEAVNALTRSCKTCHDVYKTN
jgi:cytochrome c556